MALSDTLSIGGDKLQLTLGGRYQDILQKGYDTRPLPSQGTVTSRYDDGRFSPALGVVVRPTGKLSVYGNYIEALEVGPTAPAVAVNAGEIFAPVVSKQMEIGAKYDFGAVAVTASLFEIRQPNAFTDPTTRRFSVGGLQINRGAEFTVFGKPIEGLRVLGGVTFIDAELAQTAAGQFDGNTAPGVPRTAINFYGEYDLPWIRGLTATGRMIYTSSMFYNQANTQSVPEWVRSMQDCAMPSRDQRASRWCCAPVSRTCSTGPIGRPPPAVSWRPVRSATSSSQLRSISDRPCRLAPLS